MIKTFRHWTNWCIKVRYMEDSAISSWIRFSIIWPFEAITKSLIQKSSWKNQNWMKWMWLKLIIILKKMISIMTPTGSSTSMTIEEYGQGFAKHLAKEQTCWNWKTDMANHSLIQSTWPIPSIRFLTRVHQFNWLIQNCSLSNRTSKFHTKSRKRILFTLLTNMK